ncbi:hypothetical protein N7471_013937 [Penicillium samsonianum]|uniref:uncharacterized protein n=1 Tax=Penicillium samsonianum TaxID=1882272 RepID=UPI002546F4EA|nr:uncharacterized protein N7471_013937 [Penicillium samsonianum]KAJ6118060.1 hypothetical protein N7471_013937 [Penicillium samsonianum]
MRKVRRKHAVSQLVPDRENRGKDQRVCNQDAVQFTIVEFQNLFDTSQAKHDHETLEGVEEIDDTGDCDDSPSHRGLVAVAIWR